jgi:NitT/TauT family transport system ATP-binding protein
VLEVRGVSVTYASAAGAIAALADTSLTVDRGEFVSIVGPSGCGKSTLLNVMGGLLAPTTGEVFLDGRAVTAPSPRIGFVFQDAVLLPWRTVLENVLLPAELARRTGLAGRARELLDLVGLTRFARNYPRELSGGMRQRVAIARALLLDPEVLLMDEPFGALDAITRERMNVELLRIWQHSGKTVVFVTHAIPEAVFLSDRVAAMTERPGRVKEIYRVTLARPRGTGTMEEGDYLAICRVLRELMVQESES